MLRVLYQSGFLLCPALLVAQISGFRTESLTLSNGVVLENVEIKGVSRSGVIIQHGRSLTSIPPTLLPEGLHQKATEEMNALSLRKSHLPPEKETALPTYKQRRWAEIEANREAQRQVAIEAAKGLVSDAAPHSSPAKPFIEYNDMRLYSPDIGVGWGTAIIENTGRTSRSLNSFDLKVVYSDGVTRSVRMLRPFRLERSTRQQISFYVYDRYHAIPLYVRWDRKRELLPVNRQYVETKSYSTTRRFHRPYHRNDGDGIYPRPDPY